MKFYADGNRTQQLNDHLEGVSQKAASFAEYFKCRQWGHLLGKWHDLGKFSDGFQQYMFDGKPRVEHAVVGGRYATDFFADLPQRIAIQFAITCHHTGLQNADAVRQRLKKADHLVADSIKNIPGELLSQKLPDWPEWLSPPSNSSTKQNIDDWKRSLEFWIRMLHSCLVDADWLDAEKRNLEAPVRPKFPLIKELRDRLDAYIDKKVNDDRENNWTSVNSQREIVLKACRSAATQTSGYYSLTVPTGGGKTLSGMSFALNHAVENELRRIIVVIPYTSIIEQNAGVFKDVFGKANVVEHHSSLCPEEETERNRLASENWDAPIIVTTNVQLFESLFANKNSRLRKLHNISRSVIILDEAQSLPPRLLYSILDAIRELKENYGCSIVICTATQPALKQRLSFPKGLDEVREIIPDSIQLARDLSRVQVEWPDKAKTEYQDIADQVEKEKFNRVLLVTHKRKDARTLAQLLPKGTYHLSASMCAAHRTVVLSDIKNLLKEKSATVRLVSTQLIEAGVDVDFPVVFRALSGMDSIAQAAGRCNREGKDDKGRLIVFRAPTEPPPGILRLGKGITESLLNSCGEEGVPANNDVLDFTHPDVFKTYFRLFYANSQLDSAGVQTARAELDFPEVSRRFRMIDNAQTYAVVVPYGDAYEKLEVIRNKFQPTREDFRSLQPFIVQLYSQEFNRLNEVGVLDMVHESFFCLTQPYQRLYDIRFGLVVSDENLFPDYSKYNV